MSILSPSFDMVYFKLFDDCNAKCNMCDCWVRPRSPKGIDHYRAVLADVLTAGPKSIRFTGGEPLLLRELPQLVEMAADAGARVSVISNGRLLRGKVAQLATHGCEEIVLSLDGVGDTHDRIRNTPGLFRLLMAAIVGINRTSMSYGINTVVQQQGIRELRLLSEILLQQSTPPRWWHLIPVRDRADLRPSADDVEWLHATLPAVVQQMARRRVTVVADAGMFEQVGRAACQVPGFAAYVDAESGQVYSCNMLAYSDPPIGNVIASTMNTVWLGEVAARVRGECVTSAHGTCARCDTASRMMNLQLREHALAGRG